MQQSSRRWLIIVVTLVVLLAVGWFVGRSVFAANNVSATLSTSAITRGDIQASVLSSGALQPANDLNLTFGTAGTLANIAVKQGDRVKQGQVIATLDPTDLNLAVTQAQAGLDSAQAKLDSLNAGPSAAQLSSAKLKVSQAQANLDKAKLTSSIQLQEAQMGVDSAQRSELNAQDKYNTVATPLLDSRGILLTTLTQDQINTYNSTFRALQDAKDSLTKAQLSQKETQLDQSQSVTSAQQSLDDANTQLQSLSAPPVQTDLETAKASVDGAQANLAAAKQKVQQASLTAPFAGVIVNVPATVGAAVGANANIAELLDDSSYHLTMSVSESDIQSIKTGLPVNVSFDALPDAVYTGTVTYVSPSAQTQQGVVSYPATVTLDPKAVGGGLRPGMSATASVVTDDHADALLVANRAVRTEGRQKVVYIVGPGGTQIPVPVQTGLSDTQSTEITGNTPLREGDSAILPATTTGTTSTGGGGLGGLLNFGGGGGRRSP